MAGSRSLAQHSCFLRVVPVVHGYRAQISVMMQDDVKGLIALCWEVSTREAGLQQLRDALAANPELLVRLVQWGTAVDTEYSDKMIVGYLLTNRAMLDWGPAVVPAAVSAALRQQVRDCGTAPLLGFLGNRCCGHCDGCICDAPGWVEWNVHRVGLMCAHLMWGGGREGGIRG